MRIIFNFLSLLAAIGSVQAQNAPSVQAIAVEGTLLKVTLSDGRVLRSPDLIGTDLIVGEGDQQIHVRIDAIERDLDDDRGGIKAEDAIWLHTLSVEEDGGNWGPLCESGPDGRQQAIPISGRFLASEGRFAAQAGPWASAFALATIRGRHRPIMRRRIQSLDLYNACIRAIRADYGGNGTSTTRNGMLIDLYNKPGATSSGGDAHMSFEAGWIASGAVCVNHPRVAENITLANIEARWPQLAGKTGAACTEEAARSLGALFFNRSAP